ncbi:MAG TPA: cell surface protein SprA [Bacteroidota bacterium]|nr:cell surface protein SprA [Bacteroidota bacterium]
MADIRSPLRGMIPPPYTRAHTRVILLALALNAVALLLPTPAGAQVPPAVADSLRLDSLQRGLIFPFPGINDTTNVRLRGRGRDSLHAGRDSLGFLRDSLRGRGESGVKIDTAWVPYLDSTSRLQQFIHRRSDMPMVELFPRENYSLYLDVRSAAYNRRFELDSAGRSVTVREQVNGKDVKIPVSVPLEDYIGLRSREEKRRSWRELVTRYQYKETQDQLGGFLSSLTNIEIPVPANPILSIFGGRGIKLNVSGAVDIRGAFRNQSSDQVTLSRQDQSRSEPDFNQTVQVNVNGTIGDKLNILADWNTQRTFEYENQLKIKYTGYEDEVVQSVEAGNVSLQTPSLVGGGQALFGIKARMQAGPLTLTTLVSQKKGQTKELTLTGGAQSSEFPVLPTSYAKNYYFVDTLYRKFYANLHSSPAPTIGPDVTENQILQIDVWQSLLNNTPSATGTYVTASAYVNLPGHPSDVSYAPDFVATFDTTSPGNYKRGYWTRLDPTKDYRYDKSAGTVTLLTSVVDAQAIAVNYTIVGAGGRNQVYGDSVGHNLYLKLIKPENIQDHPGYKPAWDLMLKNIYPLGGRDLKEEGFKFKVLRHRDGTTDDFQIYGTNLLAVLGLDRFDAAKTPKAGGDGEFDFIKGVTVDVERAEIIFPSLRPFDSTIVQYFRGIGKAISDSLLFSDIYDTTATAAQYNAVKNRYFMQVTSSTSQSSRYQLGFNLVEGSVQVLWNGTPLLPTVDYTVDYIVGEVIIRKPEALLPGASVQVKYEQNDLFQLASKTLIGARGEMVNLFPNTNIGFTVMSLSQATLSDKVRLGEEPTSNMIMGFDASTSFNLPFLTQAIDALPFIRTREMSSIRFGGEAAYVLPNPNTKTSTITDDNGASIAYLDDFEGARRTIPLPISYSAWHLASAPAYSLLGAGLTNEKKTYAKGRLVWYNRLPSDVVSQEIWPHREVRTGENLVTVLNLDYDPRHRGMYNFSPKLDSTLHRPGGGYDFPDTDGRKLRQRNWGGIMRYISNAAGLIDQNIAYLELWIKPITPDQQDLRHGKLFIDLGRVNEDVIPNGSLNSEDIIKTPQNPEGIPNGVLNTGEDVGLDMLADSAEQRVYAGFVASNSGDPDVNPNDPSGDDWSYATGDSNFSKINGVEGNVNGVDGRLPDTEDLNSNGAVDQVDQYNEYEVPLDSVYYDSLGIEQRNTLIVGGDTWHQIRIPLFSPSRIIGGDRSAGSVLSEVQYVRLWMSGFESPVRLRIAEMNFVGNQWIQRSTGDSTLKVSVVNIEDNPSYTSPPGVIRERDKTQPDRIIFGNEQSLSLVLNGLRRGETRQVYRSFAVRPLDLFNYKTMKMFVHGDPAIGYYAPDRYDAEAFIRFGSDSLNFYEYRQPIRPGWDPLNDMNIIFSQLTSVKATRDSLNKLYRIDVPNGHPGATYGVQGNPSLRQIREISIGITNPALQGGTVPLVGQIWVNELRLTDVDNSKGFAYRFDTQVKLADLGGVSFNYSKTDPFFHGLDQRFGGQTTQVNWGVNANASLEHFFSQDWQGTTIPVGYSHSEGLIKPRYLPNSDVVVVEAANLAARGAAPDHAAAVTDSVVTTSQTLHVQDSYSIPNFRLALPSQAWYVRDTFSKLSWAFNYSTSHDRDPAITMRRSWQWNFKLSYGVALPSDYYIQPFKHLFNGIFILDSYKDWKFYLLPITSLSANVGAQRSRTYEVSRDPASTPRDSRNFSGGKSFGFGWKLTEGGLSGLSGDYGLSLDRNLLVLDNDSAGRGLSSIFKDIFFKGADSRYGQRVTFNSKPRIPDVFDIPKYLTLNAGYAVNYAWQNAFQNGDIGKSAGFDNNVTLSFDFRLKSLFDPLFQSKAEPVPAAPRSPSDSTAGKGEKKDNLGSLLAGLKTAATIFLKIPFLDYETINISFAQTNHAANSGVVGSTGFRNFWGRLPFQGSVPEYGPSRLYQLGLISDPSGSLRFSPHSGFPYFGWSTVPGVRAPNAQLADQYGQTNSIALRTNRPLWPGATLEVNWKVGWQFQKSTTFLTDAFGNRAETTTDASGNLVAAVPTIATQGSIERSFLTLPPVFFLKVFKSNLEDVGKKYNRLNDLDKDPTHYAEHLAESFEKGLEALPFLNRVLGQYVPRPNWSLRWDGLEKIAGIGSVVERMSLEHAYTASFRRDFRGDISGGERTDIERVQYGFAPLAGINATFKEFLKGNMTGTLRYNSSTAYDLNLAAQNITETASQEISLSLSYSRRGFKFPLFGLTLSNDVDVSLTFSRTKNSRRSHDPNFLDVNQEGTPIEGSTRTSAEPRIRYVLSTRVSAALFYRFTKVAPDEGGSLITGTTTNEAGVEIHITI